MRKNISVLVLAIVFLASLLVGVACDDDDGGGSSTSNSALCKKGCALYEKCEGSGDVNLMECTVECTEYFNETLKEEDCESEIRDYYICGVNLSCNDVMFGDGYGDLIAINGKCTDEISALTSCESGGGDTGGGDACETCLTTNCVNEVGACSQNNDCLSLLTCISNCADETCAQTCVQQYPGGISLLNDIITCTETKCASECA